jgi:hypothetical protein
MKPTEAFLWGVAGSVAVEVVAVWKHYDGDGVELPARYKRVSFYITRILLAAIGGGLAVAYQVQAPFVALHIGAATPLIIRALTETTPMAVKKTLEETKL